MLLLTLALSSLLAVEVLDVEMNPEERKQTGISKLSDKEKAHLLTWIDQYYVKREIPLAEKPLPQKSPLQENLQNGNYIRLADKTTWNIRPQDVPIVQGWITPIDISISQSGDPTYPYRLTNTVSGSSVLARKVDKYVEPAAPTTPTPTTPPTQKAPPPPTVTPKQTTPTKKQT